MKKWKKWKHVTKLDPEKNNTEKLIKTVVESGTDAIMIGGTQNITSENILDLFKKVYQYDIPIVIEATIKNIPNEVVEKSDYIFVPIVLNTKDGKYITNLQSEAIAEKIKKYSSIFFKLFVKSKLKKKIIPEGYIVLNKDSAVAKLTNAKTDISKELALGYALFGEIIGLPIIYIEYSGKYGDPDLVKYVSDYIDTHLFYGGGIKNRVQSLEMLRYADTVIVGNIVYEDILAYLQTVP